MRLDSSAFCIKSSLTTITRVSDKPVGLNHISAGIISLSWPVLHTYWVEKRISSLKGPSKHPKAIIIIRRRPPRRPGLCVKAVLTPASSTQSRSD